MKRVALLLFGCVLLIACNNATDGDSDTDTTNFPVDTNQFSSPSDTAGHLNSSSGSISTDTTTRRPSPDGASKATPRSSRKTTPHDPARIDTLKQ